MAAPHTILLALGPQRKGARVIRKLLRVDGGRLLVARSARQLFTHLDSMPVDLVLLDQGFPEPPGMELLLMLRDRMAPPPVIMLADPAEPQSICECLRRGADDCVVRPFRGEELRARVDHTLERAAMEHRVRNFQTLAPATPLIIQDSPAMRRALHLVARIAPTRSTVLILGESGVGKELFARAIHRQSPRIHGPWIPLNCSAIPESIIESELFGHERGAFTGAISQTKGKFELADGGTVFLDEVGEMNRSSQAKLLRILEERETMRVGGSRPVRIDVRVLAATNSDLQAKMRTKEFREDLFFRLNVVSIRVPALRERREDIPHLADHFLGKSIRTNCAPLRRFHPQVLDLFLSYSWPGNVRELKNLIENLVLTVPTTEIAADDLPTVMRHPRAAPPAPGVLRPGMAIHEAEKELIRRTLVHVRGNRAQAAGLLQIGVRTLQRKIRRYDLS
ncbi:MAG: sigma 54-interacting transcriptional regulator [Acidobacteriota bacterium]